MSRGVRADEKVLATPGSGRVPVDFGGVEFRPGAWLYSDEDGIVLAPRRLL